MRLKTPGSEMDPRSAVSVSASAESPYLRVKDTNEAPSLKAETRPCTATVLSSPDSSRISGVKLMTAGSTLPATVNDASVIIA